jgi:hypothetical protein
MCQVCLCEVEEVAGLMASLDPVITNYLSTSCNTDIMFHLTKVYFIK